MMKQVVRFGVAKPEIRELDYEIELEDGSKSEVKLIKDDGEWVLQSINPECADEVRYCQSELEVILGKIKELNNR